MDLSPVGRAALKAREGERLTAYRDSVGVWTIGVGVTTASGLINVVPGLTITAAQSDALFTKAARRYIDPVAAVVKVPLADHQADALISLCYNIGPDAFRKSSIVRRLNAGDYAGAAEAILMWRKPAEIISRRQAEYDQFLSPYAKSLPKARRSDAQVVKVAATLSTAGPNSLGGSPPPSTSTAKTSNRPALTSGLSSGSSSAPGFWARLHAALSRKAA